MKFDTTVRELQKEKADLEAKLKQVIVALAALSKLGGKQSLPAPRQPAQPVAMWRRLNRRPRRNQAFPRRNRLASLLVLDPEKEDRVGSARSRNCCGRAY
jgi:hypothetical protein